MIAPVTSRLSAMLKFGQVCWPYRRQNPVAHAVRILRRQAGQAQAVVEVAQDAAGDQAQRKGQPAVAGRAER